MARNSSGTHSLPAGNPVVTGTAISSTVHNNTLADLSAEITDSLSRSGKGPMQAPLELTDGTKTLPALTFDADPDSGIYRAGSGDVRVSCNDTDIFKATTAGVDVTGKMAATGAVSGTTGTFTGVVNGPNGAVGTPTYAFTNDVDSGLYLAAAGDVRIAVAGADHLVVTTTGIDAKSKKISNVTNPSAAQDAATKSYAESVTAIVTAGTFTAGHADWNVASMALHRVGSIIHLYGLATATVGAATWTNIGSVSTGFIPSSNRFFPGIYFDASATAYFNAMFTLTDAGALEVSAGVGASLPAIATGDQIRLDWTFIL